MPSRSDGYFTDIQYTRKYYRHMSPGQLAFACLRQGVAPPELGPGSVYLELGCGQGFGLNVLAAANPEIEFWGVDFHPGHIDNARQLSRAAGLANVRFEDFSFQQMLDLPEGRIPRCEVITLHGVFSWVSPENRAHIVRILDRHLKPGGMVMVSYNALPGWAEPMALRHFVKSQFDRTVGPARTRVLDAFRRASELFECDASIFGSPQVKTLIQESLAADPAYLIHEYCNDHFHPQYHAEVVAELAGARLTFVASTSVAHDLTSLAAPQAMQDMIERETDSVWRQTLLDYASGRRFRRDVFLRGPNLLDPGEREKRLHQLRFALIRPPGPANFEFTTPFGSIKGDPVIFGAVVEALAAGPLSYGDLVSLPPFAGDRVALPLKTLGLLIAGGFVHPLAPAGGGAEPAQRFNRSLLQSCTIETAPRYLAAPVVGAGIRLEFIELLALQALDDGPLDHKALARHWWNLISADRSNAAEAGDVLAERASRWAEMVTRLKAFEAERLPLYRSLGVV